MILQIIQGVVVTVQVVTIAWFVRGVLRDRRDAKVRENERMLQGPPRFTDAELKWYTAPKQTPPNMQVYQAQVKAYAAQVKAFHEIQAKQAVAPAQADQDQ